MKNQGFGPQACRGFEVNYLKRKGYGIPEKGPGNVSRYGNGLLAAQDTRGATEGGR